MVARPLATNPSIGRIAYDVRGFRAVEIQARESQYWTATVAGGRNGPRPPPRDGSVLLQLGDDEFAEALRE